MKLIIGLGNPGHKYQSTRHNIGFMVTDAFQKRYPEKFSEFVYRKKYESEISEGMIASEKVILMKPQAFMNNAGHSLKKVVSAESVESSDIIIIQDDSDLGIGKIKIKKGGAGAGHKGILSVRNIMRIDEMTRLLIGIRDVDGDLGQKSETFVLKKFPKGKDEIIRKVINRSVDCLKFLIESNDIKQAMNQYNGLVR